MKLAPSRCEELEIYVENKALWRVSRGVCVCVFFFFNPPLCANKPFLGLNADLIAAAIPFALFIRGCYFQCALL